MKLDPRTKMLMAFCISTLSIIYNTADKLFLLFAVTVLLLCLFRINIREVLRTLKPFLYMLLGLFLIQCIFVRSGKALLRIGDVTLVTSGGFAGGAGVVLRILILVSAALLFTTFSANDFILGLVQWKFPYELAFTVALGIRFLPLFRDEAVNVITAVQLRGVELKKVTWGKRIDLFSRLLFPIIYSAMIKARQMSVAVETRGFRVYPRRTYVRKLTFCFADYAVMLFFVLAALILLAMEIN